MKRGLLACGLLVACAPPVEPNFEAVRERVAARAGAPPLWNRGGPEERLIEETVRELLAAPLDLDRAVKIALIHSPELQAKFAALGVAEADLAAASALANPKIGVGLGLRADASGGPIVQGGFALGLASMLTLSARRAITAERRSELELSLTHAVLERVAEVKEAYLAVQRTTALVDLADEESHAIDAVVDATAVREQDGTLDPAEARRVLARLELERHARLDADLALVAARERLNRLLGLWGGAIAWKLAEPLRGVPSDEVPLDRLESHAISARLDLEAAKHRTATVARTLAAEGDLGWLRSLDAGALVRLEEGGSPYVGPSFEIELPVFDQGQSRIARLRNELLQRRFEVTELAVSIRSRVREEREALVAARRRVVHLREAVLPMLEDLTRVAVGASPEARAHGAEGRRAALGARRELVRALEEYWRARFRLERTVGGRLP
ncbi:MAG: TolC family protein [Deltaproteobacteria bacterium]|nr:TolC family protein [Deltaproteobacteria bacterium]